VPIGAVVCGPRAADVLGPGNHGTTFGGNPLAMRAGVETLRIMEEEGLVANAAEVGGRLVAGLERELAGVPGVVEVVSGGAEDPEPSPEPSEASASQQAGGEAEVLADTGGTSPAVYAGLGLAGLLVSALLARRLLG